MPLEKKPWSAVTAVLGALWLGLFPLWQDLSYAHITRAKWVGMLALCGVTVLVCLVMALILAAKHRLGQALCRHPVQMVAAAYFGWVALSACFGSWSNTLNGQGQLVVWMGAIRYEGLLTHLCYALIFLLMSLFPAGEKTVLAAAMAGLALFCGIVALQYAGMNVMGLFPAGRSINTNYEFQGTIGNIDMVSGYLCLMTPLMLGSYIVREKHSVALLVLGSLGAALLWCIQVQAGMIALLALCVLIVLLMLRFPAYRVRGCVALAGVALALALRGCLFLPWLDSDTPRAILPVELTFTGISAIGLVTAALCLLAAWRFHRRPGKPLSPRAILALVLVLAVVLAAPVTLFPVPESAGGLYELHELLNGRAQDHFGSWRLGVWRHSLDMSRESLLFGTGPDTFYFAMADHLKSVDASLGESFDNPHNEYIAILCNNGLPALALYAALLVWLLTTLCRRRRWPMALAIGCFALQGFFSFSICLVTPMFWAVMGMAAAQCARPVRLDTTTEVI